MKRALLALSVGLILAGCGGGGSIDESIAPPLPDGSIPVTRSGNSDPGAQAERNCTVQFEGDSILYGMGAGVERLPDPPAKVLERIRPAWKVIDRSSPGSTVQQRSPMFLNEPIPARVVVVEFGVNDAGQGLSYAEPLRAFVQRIKDAGALPVVTGLARSAVQRRDEYDAIARRIAGEEKAKFADWGSVGRADEEMADPVHPGSAYSARLVEQLARALDVVAPECK